MPEVKIDRLEIDEKISLSVYNNKIAINIDGLHKLAFVNYTEDLLEIIKNARFRVPNNTEAINKYKYPYSNKYKKYLHQIVFDYYFGEDVRKKLYELGYIIEHLDNDGFNCDISNLFILKDIKNTYKGWHFDKESKIALPILALKIYHIMENRTFQITIVFNQTFINSKNKTLDTIRLLYDYNYEIVLQDAEQILESIVKTGHINFERWKSLYRFNDIELTYASQIELSEEEKKQEYGTLIYREGKAYILLGQSENSIGLMNSIPYKANWNLK
ncbi:hypothetical protein Q428_14350 [Fervidicella metallireducens AeB]|uniref:Uncharacterized protein n=1 Tax=Fervidicella metallireducens AeB TaxID=1403537 RepID=A0A017RRL7_9CLOT|nr:hypothetical protein [Fervidicella metallireducens]EYE87246.1 hypothetical protein Q428_14350 [Fervidicella metallireducens AeB]